MKKILVILFSLSLTSILVGQEILVETKYDTVAVAQRDFYLNSTLRSDLLGGNNRAGFSFTLPESTDRWYYSFTTERGESGMNNLNLAAQLGASLLDPTLGSSDVVVPDGVSKINVYSIASWNYSTFTSGGEFNYNPDKSSLQSPQGLIEVRDDNVLSQALGFVNTSSTDGVHIFVEVVAITKEDIVLNADEISRAESYGQLAVMKFEYAQYELAKKYCDSSLAIFPLGWVYGTKAACHYAVHEDGQVSKSLVKGIELMKEQGDYNAEIKLIQREFRLLKKKEKMKGAQQYIDLLWTHRFND